MTQSSTTTSLPDAAGTPSVGQRAVWGMAALLVALFAWLHWEFLVRSSMASIADPNWSHIAVVPFISGYYIFLNRERLTAMPQCLFWPGLAIVFLGLFSYLWWIFPGRNDMFRGYSMILTLLGIVLFTQGPARMRVLWFPIAYMMFAVKVPDSLWERIAFQLTLIASAGSEVALDIFAVLLDFNIVKEGQSFTMTWIEDGKLVEHGFNIAQACSGLRMLMAFCALGVALAFLWDRTWWQRAIMVLMAVPIALGVNIARVTTLGLLNLVNPELAQGDFHIAVGMMMLLPAALLFLGLGKVLDMMLIDEDDDDESDGGAGFAGENPGGDSGLRVAQPSAYGVGRLLPWFLGGVFVALTVGMIYVLLLNGTTASPMIEQLGSAASFGLAGVLVVPLVVGFFWLRSRVRGLLGGMVVVAGVLLASAVGLQSVVAATQFAFIKQSVEMRHGFYALPKAFGPWEFAGQDEPLDKYVEDELGTQEYITRYYRDTRLAEDDASAVARIHLAYYTGMIDTVPHVADRCWVAGGITPGDVRTFDITLDLQDAQSDPEVSGGSGVVVPVQQRDPVDGRATVRLPQATVPVHSFTGHNPQTGREVGATYFFVANGGFYASPNDVRLLGFDPRDKYSYYCKVEISFPGLKDMDRSEERVSALLSDMLPEIMACLPDWPDVRAGRWPTDAPAVSIPITDPVTPADPDLPDPAPPQKSSPTD